MKFKIEVVDDQHIKVYGKTLEESHNNAIEFWKLFIGDKWISINWAQYASFDNEYGIAQTEIWHKPLGVVIPAE